MVSFRHRGPRRRPASLLPLLSACLLLLLLLLSSPAFHRPASALEAAFTPSEGDDASGPLPQSTAYREQLTKLYEAIVSSPDPEGALAAAAKSSNMSPEDLAGILRRHAQDMGLFGGGGAPSLVRRLLGLAVRICRFLFEMAQRWARGHPRAAAGAGALAVLCGWVLAALPRSGVAVPFGRGTSTVCLPPRKFAERVARAWTAGEAEEGGGWTARMEAKVWDLPRVTVEEEEGEGAVTFEDCGTEGGLWKKKKKKKIAGENVEDLSDLSVCATARRSVPVPPLDEDEDDDDAAVYFEDDEEEEEDPSDLRAALAADLTYDAAVGVLQSRRFGEYLDPTSLARRFYAMSAADDAPEGACLVLRPRRRLLRRHDLHPLLLSHEDRKEDVPRAAAAAAFRASEGQGGLRGEIRFGVERDLDGDGAPRVACSVTFAGPAGRRGAGVRDTEAGDVVRELAGSFARTAAAEAARAAARRKEARGVRKRAAAASKKRRSARETYLREMEEMARERRKKWKRAGGAGERWRPSGHRQRSPLNC